jgi:hypothetical protein
MVNPGPLAWALLFRSFGAKSGALSGFFADQDAAEFLIDNMLAYVLG